MKLEDFRLRKNRQRPELCYGYEKKEGNRKLLIFTMDAGKTFLATIEKGRGYTSALEFSKTFSTKDECLNAFDEQLN